MGYGIKCLEHLSYVSLPQNPNMLHTNNVYIQIIIVKCVLPSKLELYEGSLPATLTITSAAQGSLSDTSTVHV